MPPTSTKRPFSQIIPEPPAEVVQGTTIVVIQPGSYNLRIGRASDPYPQTIPHCIARRHRFPGKQKHYEDPWMVRPEFSHSEFKHQLKAAVKTADEVLLTRPMMSGEYRKSTQYKQLLTSNMQSKGETTEVMSPTHWTNTHSKPQYLIGEEALHVKPSDHYNLYWPIRRGRLNLHPGPNGSLTAVLQDLETIWSEAIKNSLDIPLKNLKHYRAVVLIPDIYNRLHVKELLNIVLNRMGFSSAIVIQESVCATFGTGVGSACIVDVGDQKTSVCCVEDGISHRDTRFHMDFGGIDISRSFYVLLHRISFPYKEVSLSKRMDALLLQELKESFCHLDQDSSGATQQSFQVKHPNERIRKYCLWMGDECILAPMAFFCPDLLGIKGENLTHVQQDTIVGDAEDPYDDFYLQQTQQQSSKKKAEAETEASQNADMPASLNEDSISNIMPSQFDEDSIDQSDSITISETQTSTRPASQMEEKIVEEKLPLLALDQAVLKSIDRCESDDMKKRMYSCIVVVGGGMMFEGAQSWLQYRIWTQMPGHFRLQLETMDVITRPKDFDPRLTCWKGAAILACLDTGQELWVKQREWKKYSVKVLRERAPFVW
ncbi:actin-related protein 8-like [Lineus longissimus]|uniref:actin-related protein 8-like n=1 Tax=Lineus longissimus TaxID=88925 RepID=UPI002B4F2394